MKKIKLRYTVIKTEEVEEEIEITDYSYNRVKEDNYNEIRDIYWDLSDRLDKKDMKVKCDGLGCPEFEIEIDDETYYL